MWSTPLFAYSTGEIFLKAVASFVSRRLLIFSSVSVSLKRSTKSWYRIQNHMSWPISKLNPLYMLRRISRHPSVSFPFGSLSNFFHTGPSLSSSLHDETHTCGSGRRGCEKLDYPFSVVCTAILSVLITISENLSFLRYLFVLLPDHAIRRLFFFVSHYNYNSDSNSYSVFFQTSGH